MDEATGQGSEAVDQQGSDEQRSPEEIERDIERTREELGETAAAVAQKADVKAQAKEKVDELKTKATAKKDELGAKARETSPESASAGAQQVATTAQENPLPFAVGGALVAGFLIGRLTKR
jgi:ElaB/YqjD/DUF883 family membrane-anchored ribosome-binding protein